MPFVGLVLLWNEYGFGGRFQIPLSVFIVGALFIDVYLRTKDESGKA